MLEVNMTEFDYRLTFRKSKQQQGELPELPNFKENTDEKLVAEYLIKHAEDYLRFYENRWNDDFHEIDDGNVVVDDDDDDEIADTAITRSYFLDSDFFYVGSELVVKKDEVLQYLIRLRQGLEYNVDIQKKIFYEKVNLMIILLSRDERWKGRDYHGYKKSHGPDCNCDSILGKGCRKTRHLKQSMEKLKKLNLQLAEQRKKIDDKVDPKFKKFKENKEQFPHWTKLISKQREDRKIKRRKNLLEISKLLQSQKQEGVSKGVDAHRDKLKEMENEEVERKRNYQEKLEQVRQRIILLRQQRQYEKGEKKEAEKPTVKNNKVVLNHENNVAEAKDNGNDDIVDDLDNDECIHDVNDNDLEMTGDVNESEEFNLPTIEDRQRIGNGETIDKSIETVTADNNKPSSPRKKKSKKKLPKLQKKPKSRNKKASKIPETFPQITDIKKKLTMTKQTPKTISGSKKGDRKKRSKLTKEPRVEIIENKETNEQKANFMEVDLGKDYNIQQIVLETKVDTSRVKSKKKGRKISKSFTLSYSGDGENWYNYNDATGNAYVFNDESNDPFSIHVLEEGIVTRHLRVYPTSDKNNNLKIRETLLGIECKDNKIQEKEEKILRQPRKKHSRLMDTPSHFRRVTMEEPWPSQLTPILPEPIALEVVVEKKEEIEDSDCEDMFQDDLTVHLMEAVEDQLQRQNSTVPVTSSRLRRKKPIMFSVDDINNEIDLDEERRFRKEAEERRQRMRREEMLESRQKGIREKMNKIRNNKLHPVKERFQTTTKDDDIDENRSHKANFLSKYCIFTVEQLQWYQAIFDDFQEYQIGCKEGWLPLEMTMDALNIINKSLIDNYHYQYIFRVLEIFDIEVKDQVDFKVFSLVAAFSERIKAFRKHFHMSKENINYSTLIPSLSKAKEMYKMLLRKKERFIEPEDFHIEIKAAKIDENILKYILQNESRSKIDFFDYLTFFPLFLFTHGVIIESLLKVDEKPF